MFPEVRRPTRPSLLALPAWASGLLVVGTVGWILGDVLGRGGACLSPSFIAGFPSDAGRAGGIFPIIMATCLILGVALVCCVPISMGAAVFLAEFAGTSSRIGRLVERSLDTLAAMPSIVFGLFGAAFFCRTLGLGFSILSGGMTLACMILPIVIRTTEAGLRSVPSELRLEAAALGFSRTGALRHVLFPAAAPAVTAGLVLGIGRALSETAALLFTSGYVDRMPRSLLDSGRTLSIHIFDLSMNVPGGDERAAATAALLMGMVLILNGAATVLTSRWLRRHYAE